MTFVNSLIVGFEDGGIDLDDDATFNNLAGGSTGLAEPLVIESSFLDNVGPNIIVEAGDPVDLAAFAADPALNIVEGTADLSGQSFVAGAPGIVPGPVIGAVTAVDPTTLGLEPGTFLGAISGADDTTFEGWTFDETP